MKHHCCYTEHVYPGRYIVLNDMHVVIGIFGDFRSAENAALKFLEDMKRVAEYAPAETDDILNRKILLGLDEVVPYSQCHTISIHEIGVWSKHRELEIDGLDEPLCDGCDASDPHDHAFQNVN